MVAASVLAAACSDVISLATGRARSDLAMLLLKSAAPAPVNASFYASNSRSTVRNFSHPDASLTPYLRVTFPANSLATVSGGTATSTDSVLVTVQHMAGAYGFTLSVAPAATFSGSNPPTVTFFYGSYGDFTASRAGSRYGSSTEYANALTLWHEQLVDRYDQVTGSGAAGTDAVGGYIQSPGTFLAAAPK